MKKINAKEFINFLIDNPNLFINLIDKESDSSLYTYLTGVKTEKEPALVFGTIERNLHDIIIHEDQFLVVKSHTTLLKAFINWKKER